MGLPSTKGIITIAAPIRDWVMPENNKESTIIVSVMALRLM